MTEIDQVVDIAKAEVGYIEKAKDAYMKNHKIVYDKKAGAGKDNYNKYAEDLDQLKIYNTPKQGYPWCNIFVDWCFIQSLGLKRAKELLYGFSAGCEQDWNWFESKNRIFYGPKRGDLVVFGACDHIGIVYKVANGKIYTIEGNTSNDAILVTNGGVVTEKEYRIESTHIKGYLRPLYKGENGSNLGNNSGSNVSNYPILQNGSTGKYVTMAQKKLIEKGYKLPRYGADGCFGGETEEAVKNLQRDAGISVDGVIGPETWKVLYSNFKGIADKYPGYVISRGSTGANVQKIQKRLIALGYSCGKWGSDGVFGADTESAVKKYQLNKGLQVDGMVGPATWKKLFG